MLAEAPRRAGARRGRADPGATLRAPSWSRATATTRARSSPPRTASPAPLPILADEFVTTEDGTGIVHLAPAFGEDDYRVAAASERVPFDPTRRRSRCYNPVRPDGTFDGACASRDGALLRGPLRQGPGADGRADRGPARARPAAARAGLRALLPALLALRHAADLLRETVVVHRDLALRERAAGGQRDGQLASAARQARPLRRLAGRTTSTGRSRASATGARRCRCGAARAGTCTWSAPSRSSRSAPGTALADHHRPYVDELAFPCPRCSTRSAHWASRCGACRR